MIEQGITSLFHLQSTSYSNNNCEGFSSCIGVCFVFFDIALKISSFTLLKLLL